MPRSNSDLSLSERRERAFTLFSRGWTNAKIARDLHVDADTVGRYRQDYEDRMAEVLHNDPAFLRDIASNTIRMLEENEQVRREAWERYESATSDTNRVQYLNTIVKAQEQRSKLLGVLGVKHEFLLHVQNVQRVQEQLISFMRAELCASDRDKLQTYLEGLSLPALPEGAGV